MNAFLRQFRNGDILPWERGYARELLRVALPIVVQSLFMASLHIIDNLMIGQLGETELAAVTQANRVTFLYQLLLSGLSCGTAALVAQYWGKKDLQGIRSVMGLAMCVSLAVGLVFCAACSLFPEALMRLLLNEEAAVEAAASYLRVIAFGYPLSAGTFCYASVLKSTEQTRLPMAASICALVTNTILNYCLIFGNFGFPKLGVRGGAIATMIAIAIELAVIVSFGYILRLATAARLSELLPRSLSLAKKFFSVAMPVIVNEGLWSFGMVVYSAVYGRMGTATVAAVSIFTTVQQIAMATMRGVTHGAAVLVGKRIGAGDEAGAARTARRMLWLAIPSGLLSGLILIASSGPITSLFPVSDTVMRDARLLITFCAATIWMNQLSGLLIVGVLYAGGDVRMALAIDAGTTWAVGVPIVAFAGLVLKLPVPYVFLLSEIEIILKAVLCFHRFRSGKWIHNLVRE